MAARRTSPAGSMFFSNGDWKPVAHGLSLPAFDAVAQAEGQIGAGSTAALYQQPANFAQTLAGLYGQYGKSSTDALNAYTNPYSQAAQGLFAGQAGMGRSIGDMYSAGVGALGGIGAAGAAAAGQAGGQAAGALGGLYGNANAAIAKAFGDSAGSLASRDAGVANAYGQLGSSGMTALANMYGSGIAGQAARDQSALSATGSIGVAGQSALANMFGSGASAMAARDAARTNAIGSIGAAAAGRESAIFGAQGQLGAANQNALASYGGSRDAALANMSIAAANGLGQLGVANYNMQGQLGSSLAAVAAAEAAAKGNAAAAQQAAGPQYAKLQYLSSAMPQILDTVKYGIQTAPYTAGNMPSFGGGSSSGYGDIGFTASGPNGLIASGSAGSAPGWSGGGGAGRPFTPPPGAPPTGAIPSPSFAPPALPSFTEGSASARSFLDSLLDRNDNPNSQASQVRSGMMSEFGANRDAVLNSGVLSSLNNNLATGYSQMASQAGAARGIPGEYLAALKPAEGDYGMAGAMSALRGQATEAYDRVGQLASNSYRPDYGAIRGQLQYSTDALRGATPRSGYDPSGAYSQINANTSFGAGNIGSAVDAAARSGADLMSSAAGAINPMLSAGVGSINDMARRMDSTFGKFGNDIGSAYGGVMGGLNENYQQAYGGINDLWNNSLGKVRQFMSPSELARENESAYDISLAAGERRADAQERAEAERWLYNDKNSPKQYTGGIAGAEDWRKMDDWNRRKYTAILNRPQATYGTI